MLWARLLAYVTGTVNQELLLRNEYLAAENRILRGQIKGRLLLSEGEKVTLAEIAHRLGRMVLENVAAAAKPDTILGWYRKFIANKFVEIPSKRRAPQGRSGNRTLGRADGEGKSEFGLRPDRRCLGKSRPSTIRSDRGQYPPSPRHFSSPGAKAIGLLDGLYPRAPGRFGGDGLLHDGSSNAQRVEDLLCAVPYPFGDSPSESGGIHPVPGSDVDGAAGAKHDDGGVGCLRGCRYLLHDRDAKFCQSFRELIKTGSVNPLRLPARSPNLKDYASHCTSWVRCDTTSLARRRCDSFMPWAFRGGLSPGCSYRQSFLSLQA